jgi:hypothetical protein
VQHLPGQMPSKPATRTTCPERQPLAAALPRVVQHGLRGIVIPERTGLVKLVPAPASGSFFFRFPPFLGSVGCGVGVQDWTGRADRVSGRRSLTSTPSFGAGFVMAENEACVERGLPWAVGGG